MISILRDAAALAVAFPFFGLLLVAASGIRVADYISGYRLATVVLRVRR